MSFHSNDSPANPSANASAAAAADDDAASDNAARAGNTGEPPVPLHAAASDNAATTATSATTAAAAAADARLPLVAIIGNPNTGKTTLFNALTGMRQRTGNYPGVTVFKKSGFVALPHAGRVELLDLPGLYSLAAASPDEQVVLDALEGRLPGLPRPDAVLCVVDSTNLLRNLFLASQAAEIGLPLAIALNQADIVRKRGITIDTAKISARLGGIPVAAVSAWRREGLDAVRETLSVLLRERRPMRRIEWRPCVADALEILRDGIRRETGQPAPDDATLQRMLFDAAPPSAAARPSAKSAAPRLSFDDVKQRAAAAAPSAGNQGRTDIPVCPPAAPTIPAATGQARMPVPPSAPAATAPAAAAPPAASSSSAALPPLSADARERLVRAARERVRHGGLNPFAAEAVLHYERITAVLDGAATENPATRELARRLDALFLHRAAGPAIFLALMAVVFAAVFWLAPIPQGWLENLFDWLGKTAGHCLEGSPMLQSLVVDGVIAGLGAFTVFLPQILILFLFIALLEDSGYMARAAFLMDKLFSWCGLNGRAFMPMLSGYACGVPGILATRTIEDPKARAATAFLVPFMSCSARLPVYTLMTTAFIVPALGNAGGVLAMMAMYLLGLAIALPTAFVLTRLVLRAPPQPFVLELPRYQMPAPRDVLVRMWDSASEFLKRAATVIFSIVIIVWALLYFPHSADVEDAARATHLATAASDAGKPVAEFEKIVADATRENFIARRAAATGKTPAAIEAELAAAEAAGDSDAGAEHPLVAEFKAFTAPAEALENAIAAAHIEHSYLGRLGKFVQPLFAPAGFDWRITVGILASFPAREAIISTLGTTYSLGSGAEESSDALQDALRKSTWPGGARVGNPVFTLPVAFGLMAFFALCSQCGATLSVIRKESGLRWAVASFVYMTFLAWLAAVACHQLGSRLLG